MFDAVAVVYHKEHLVKIRRGGSEVVVKSVEHVRDVKVYSAKHARRALKSGNIEFTAVLKCCSTRKEGKVVADESDNVPPEVTELLQAFLGVFLRS